ncbi:MAG: ABC transporter permease [Sphaerochaeta sp.]|jgi:putative ABC transport system permease protein|nr:ABC transporter permease [Sphaerochaeta sp.]MDX9914488.1 ABC transporter permease [Sphaerochaeta sp.]
MVKLALRNILRNRRRSLLSAFAIAVSAMSIILLLALVEGMEVDMRTNLIAYYTGEIRIRSSQYARYERYHPLHLSLDDEAITTVLERMDEVAETSGRISFPAALYRGDRSRPVLTMGFDFTRETAFSNLASILSEGRLPHDRSNELVMGAVLAKGLDITVGDRVTLLASTAAGSSNAMSFTVVGIVKPPIGSLSSSTLYLSLERAQHLLFMEGRVQELVVRSTGAVSLPALAGEIAALVAEELGIETETQAFSQLNEMYGFLRIAKYIYYVIALIFFLLGSTVIINTTMMVIFERMAEIGMMKALGMDDGKVRLLFLLEGAFISAAGALAGVLVGVLITAVLSRVGIDFTEAMSGIEMEVSSVLYPSITAFTAVAVYLYGVAIATLSTLIPTRRAARIQVVEALHYV